MIEEIIIKISDNEFYDDAQLLTRSFFNAATTRSVDSLQDFDREIISVSGDGKRLFLCPDALLPADVHSEMTRGEIHDIFKRRLYERLLAYTGRRLPWGFLTGVRPAKRAMEIIKTTSDERDIVISEFSKRFLASEKKAALAYTVAKNEMEILRRCRIAGDGADTGFSLYVGIPFCPTTCLYCSFSSIPLGKCKDGFTDEYIEALCREIKISADIYRKNRCKCIDKPKPASVYVGGGTPTALEPKQLERVLACINECFDMSDCFEFCVEAGRPDSITKDKLNVIKAFGADRISVNPQTMNEMTLELIGRNHTPADVHRAFELARKCGFDNINTDIILGLPGEGIAEVENTVREVEKLSPDSLTVHSLALKRAAALNIRREDFKEYDFNNSDELMSITSSLAERLGMKPYYMYRQQNMAGNFENTGYARSGKESLYNIVIMEEVQDILAVGAGASSKLLMGSGRFERAINVKDVRGYIDRVDEMIGRKEELLLQKI